MAKNKQVDNISQSLRGQPLPTLDPTIYRLFYHKEATLIWTFERPWHLKYRWD